MSLDSFNCIVNRLRDGDVEMTTDDADEAGALVRIREIREIRGQFSGQASFACLKAT